MGNIEADILLDAGADRDAIALPVRECELKLEGHGDALEKAFGSLAGSDALLVPARLQHSTYFDTPGGALWSRGYSLRIRKSQGKCLQTVKWPEPDRMATDTRCEFDVKCPDETPDISLFGGDVASQIEGIVSGAPLIKRFRTQIKRRVLMLDAWGTKIEAALDVGHIIDGTNKVPVREIELELKDGEPANLYEFAEQLSAAYNLRLGVLTKSQRGFLLAAEDRVQVRRALQPELDPAMRLDDLIAASISECLDHFVANWPALLQSDNPDAIHQMRVGIRRLRSILRGFHREIPHPKFASFRSEARDIASALGVARETDVFLDMIRSGPLRDHEPDTAVDAFVQAAVERREEGYGQAHAMLAAPQTTRFVLELRALVARRGWHAGLTAEQLISLGEPAGKFAQRALERMDRKARKLGKEFEGLSAEARHDLRILLKNIRYGAELFGGLFHDESGRRKYLRHAAHLQDQLGLANDAVVADEIIADVERRAGALSARAAGVVAGWTARGLAESGQSLAADFHQFRKARRFWR